MHDQKNEKNSDEDKSGALNQIEAIVNSVFGKLFRKLQFSYSYCMNVLKCGFHISFMKLVIKKNDGQISNIE